MRVEENSHALHVYKKYRIASLLCIFETTVDIICFIVPRSSAKIHEKHDLHEVTCLHGSNFMQHVGAQAAKTMEAHHALQIISRASRR